MTFVSVEFFLFLIGVLFLFPLVEYNRHLFVAVISSIFYLFAGGFLLLLVIFSSLFDYYCSNKIYKRRNPKMFLMLGIGVNLMFLVLVKLNFWTSAFSNESFGKIVIPIGISFYTLQSIGYLIDLYKEKIRPCTSFVEYYCYIIFFPQLIAGPIERAGSLIPQLSKVKFADVDKALQGCKLFCFGAYLKLVVSNRLAEPVQTISESHTFDLVFLLNGFVIFLFLYADFFAYTLMARGVASLFNVDLQINFNRPFRRKNLIGFWQSWHISLTKWMTDYFYIPIMLRLGNKYIFKLVFTVLTMMLVGLWHGFAVNFVVFAIIHGVLMQSLPRLQGGLKKIGMSWLKIDGRFGVLLALSITGNIFLSGSLEQWSSFFNIDNFVLFAPENWVHYQSMGFVIGVFSLVPLMYFEIIDASILDKSSSCKKEIFFILTSLLLILMLFVDGGDYVYFQF